MIPHQLRYLWYLVAGATSIPALRLGRAWWEADYRRDGLDRTEGDAELPRHLLVAGLIRHYAPGGRILDIGCGSAGLLVPLKSCYAGAALHYCGLDYSAAALEQAAARASNSATSDRCTTRFEQADFDAHRPDASFDAVVFSESLYYAPHPRDTIQRYTKALNAGGILVVSMWRRPSRVPVWRALRGELRELSRSRVRVPRRPAWDIGVYALP